MRLRIGGGTFRGRMIDTPASNTRPTTGLLRQALFNICSGSIQGAFFLDLFAGSGAMGLEALSRGAVLSTFVESAHGALKVLRSNIDLLQVEDRSEVIATDVFRVFNKLQGKTFDLIFIDPPYSLYRDGEKIKGLFEGIRSHGLLKEGGTIFLEAPADAASCLESLSFSLSSVRSYGDTLLAIYTNER